MLRLPVHILPHSYRLVQLLMMRAAERYEVAVFLGAVVTVFDVVELYPVGIAADVAGTRMMLEIPALALFPIRALDVIAIVLQLFRLTQIVATPATHAKNIAQIFILGNLVPFWALSPHPSPSFDFKR